MKISQRAEFEVLKIKYDTEVKFLEDQLELEIESKKKLSQIEIEQFKNTVDAINPDTIVQMAKAGPETQAKLLKGLGL